MDSKKLTYKDFMQYLALIILTHLWVFNNQAQDDTIQHSDQTSQAHDPILLRMQERGKIQEERRNRWKNIDRRQSDKPFVVPIYDVRARPHSVAFVGSTSKSSAETSEASSTNLTMRCIVDIENPLVLHKLETKLDLIDFHAIEEVMKGIRQSHVVRHKDGNSMLIARTDQKSYSTHDHTDVLTAAKSFGYSNGDSTRIFTVGVLTTNSVGELANDVMLQNKHVMQCGAHGKFHISYFHSLGKSQEMPRIVLDKDVSLEKFLHATHHEIADLYDKKLRDVDQQKMSLFSRLTAAPAIKQILQNQRDHAFKQLDEAKEHIAQGDFPIFAASFKQEDVEEISMSKL
jgi:hypothetical protein